MSIYFSSDHHTWKVKNKMINVGVDVWDYKPVPLETIKEIIDGYNRSD